jgi:hypothetical protein|nr:MAG TPA: hypothetical protein [Caudoviricetes sp.]
MKIVDYNEALSLIEYYKSDDDTYGYLYAIKIKGSDCEFGEWLLFAEFGACYRLYEIYKDDGSKGVYLQYIKNVKSAPQKWSEVYRERDKIKLAEECRSLPEMKSLVKRTHSKVGKARIKELMSIRFGWKEE